MLSYQHLYHAGNMADVHKHGLLAWTLDYLLRKDKPLSYIETHSGRGLYDLSAPEALRTGEAARGIAWAERARLFPEGHPYPRTLAQFRDRHGPDAYPGSPLIAAQMLRPGDSLHLAELHPGEYAILAQALTDHPGAACRRIDGLEMAQALCPPVPRRGLLLIDPSYELKDDYAALPAWIAQISRKWNVGIIMLWYPLLAQPRHEAMLTRLEARHGPDALRHEIRFAPAREGHGMVGSGLFVVNPPWGLAQEAARLGAALEAAAA